MHTRKRWYMVIVIALILASSIFWFTHRQEVEVSYLYGYGHGESIYPILDSEIENLAPTSHGWTEDELRRINRALTLIKKIDSANELLKLVPRSGMLHEREAPLARQHHQDVGAFVDALSGKVYLRPRFIKDPLLLSSALLHELMHFSKDLKFLSRARGANDTSTSQGYEDLCVELRDVKAIEIPCYQVQIEFDKKIRLYLADLKGVDPRLRNEWLSVLDFHLKDWEMQKVRHEIGRDSLDLFIRCDKIVPKAGTEIGTPEALLVESTHLIYANFLDKNKPLNVGELQLAWVKVRQYLRTKPEASKAGNPNRITDEECTEAENRLIRFVVIDSARVNAANKALVTEYLRRIESAN